MNLKSFFKFLIIPFFIINIFAPKSLAAFSWSRFPTGSETTSPLLVNISFDNFSTDVTNDPDVTVWSVAIADDDMLWSSGNCFSKNVTSGQVEIPAPTGTIANYLYLVVDSAGQGCVSDNMNDINGVGTFDYPLYTGSIEYVTELGGGGGQGGNSWGTTTVGSAVNGSVLGASTSATSKLATIVPIGFAVLIGVTLAFWLFRKFKELAQLKEQQYWDGYRDIKKGQEELYNDSLARDDKWAKFNEEDKDFGVDWKKFTNDMNDTYKV